MCVNCGAETLGTKHTLVTHGDTVVLRLCETCQNHVVLAKLVLKRDSADAPWQFEQYLPVSLEK